ncbi:MAG: hypothetical protein WC588_04030 [Candidatus Micrarchaeia archaeon]
MGKKRKKKEKIISSSLPSASPAGLPAGSSLYLERLAIQSPAGD